MQAIRKSLSTFDNNPQKLVSVCDIFIMFPQKGLETGEIYVLITILVL